MAYTAPMLHPRELINEYRNISRKTFAELMGVKLDTINQWCSGRTVTPQTMRQAADIKERLESDKSYCDRVFKEIQPHVLGYK